MFLPVCIIMVMLLADVCRAEKETQYLLWLSAVYAVISFTRINVNNIACIIFAVMLFAEVTLFSKKGHELRRNGGL